jgi:hypothetical protein
MARDLGERVWRMQRGKGAIYSTEGGEVEQKFERQSMKLQGSLDFSLYIYIHLYTQSIFRGHRFEHVWALKVGNVCKTGHPCNRSGSQSEIRTWDVENLYGTAQRLSWTLLH